MISLGSFGNFEVWTLAPFFSLPCAMLTRTSSISNLGQTKTTWSPCVKLEETTFSENLNGWVQKIIIKTSFYIDAKSGELRAGGARKSCAWASFDLGHNYFFANSESQEIWRQRVSRGKLTL